ncbi:MAG: hypothetical protein DSY33_01815 [Archaeoglobus sp.]|jgi:hypothetical protein|nr:MAG: hypothetical protein DSY33_01815 [Archaeoglobus sp.]
MRIEVNLNWSSRFCEEEIANIAQVIEKSGVKKVWAGELDLFRKPTEVAKVVEEYTSLDVGLIVKPERSIEKLVKKYDICIIPGGKGYESMKTTLLCFEKLNINAKKVYVGCSGRLMARKAFEKFKTLKMTPRLMPNYIKTEFIEWIIQGLDWEEILPIGPSLILPSKMVDELLIAALLVAGSNENFAKKFGFESLYNSVMSVDVYRMIANSKLERSDVVKKYEKTLLENFTISGNLRDVANKIKSLSKFNGVILADPFFRDINSLKFLKNLIAMVKTPIS